MASAWLFFKEFLRHPSEIAAVLPTSRALANAMVESGVEIVGRRFSPLRVLEIGAGTGAITRRLIEVLSPKDELVVIETNPLFFEQLQHTIGQLKKEHSSTCPRVKTIRGNFPEALGNISPGFHWVITSVPFNAFSREKALYLFEHMYALVQNQGVLVFQDYPLMRKMNNWARNLCQKWSKAGIPRLNTLFKDSPTVPIPKIHRQFVLWNMPPAIAFCLEKISTKP